MMTFLSSLIGFFIPAAFAQALEGAGGGPGVSSMWSTICSVLPCTTKQATGTQNGLVDSLVNSVQLFIFPLISVVAVCLVIYAGILIVTSNGSEDKIGEAKKIIMYAAAGVVLSLFTTAAVNFMMYYLGIILS